MRHPLLPWRSSFCFSRSANTDFFPPMYTSAVAVHPDVLKIRSMFTGSICDCSRAGCDMLPSSQRRSDRQPTKYGGVWGVGWVGCSEYLFPNPPGAIPPPCLNLLTSNEMVLPPAFIYFFSSPFSFGCSFCNVIPNGAMLFFRPPGNV